MTMAPPDWYPDPTQVGRQRYWNGGSWTETTRLAAPAPPLHHDQAQPSLLGDPQAQPAFQPQAQATFQPRAQATFQPQAQPAFQPQAPASAGPGATTWSPGLPTMTPGLTPRVSARLAPEPPPKPTRTRTVVLVALAIAAALLVAKFGVPPLLDAINDPPPATSAADVKVPAGWKVFTSRSGAVAYARDPLWIDYYSVQQERRLDSSGLAPGVTTELAGTWSIRTKGLSSSVEVGMVVWTAPGTELAPESAPQFLGRVSGTTSSARFGGSDRYDGWRVDYTTTDAGQTIYCTRIVLIDGDTGVLILALSAHPREDWIDDITETASSVVILGPAVDL